MLNQVQFNQDRNEQMSLADQLLRCAARAAAIGKPLDLEYTSFIIALLHGVGKVAPEVQETLAENSGALNYHSAGAYYLKTRINALGEELSALDIPSSSRRYIEDWPTYAITAQAGLYDCIGYDGYHARAEFVNRVQKMHNDPVYEQHILPYINEELIPACQKKYGLDLDDLIINAAIELASIHEQIDRLHTTDATLIGDTEYSDRNRKQIARSFYDGCTLRLLLSILTEARLSDGANSPTAEAHALTRDETVAFFREGLSALDDVDSGEKEVLMRDHAARHPAGIYRLNLPETQKKLRLSANYVFAHALVFAKSRAIFLCESDENRRSATEVMRHLLRPDRVHECTSNLSRVRLFGNDIEADDAVHSPLYYGTDGWRDPIVLCNGHGFIDAAFGNDFARLRRFSGFINAVIVFENINELPLRLRYSMNLMQNYLAHIMEATIVHLGVPPDNKGLSFPVYYGNRSAVPFKNPKAKDILPAPGSRDRDPEPYADPANLTSAQLGGFGPGDPTVPIEFIGENTEEIILPPDADVDFNTAPEGDPRREMIGRLGHGHSLLGLLSRNVRYREAWNKEHNELYRRQSTHAQALATAAEYIVQEI